MRDLAATLRRRISSFHKKKRRRQQSSLLAEHGNARDIASHDDAGRHEQDALPRGLPRGTGWGKGKYVSARPVAARGLPG